MATAYILRNRDEKETFRTGGKTVVFPASSDASTFLAGSKAFAEDVLPKRSTNAKTWDVITVTIP